MDNENYNGEMGSLISTFISFKAKLIILLSIFSFLLIIIVPVLLLTVLSSSYNINVEDQSQTSSNSGSGDISEGNEDYDDSTVILGGNPSKAGYIFPVAGLSRKNINNLHYPSYKGHTGVDVNIGVKGGKKVVAVKERNRVNINSSKS